MQEQTFIERSETDVLALAASLERSSENPLRRRHCRGSARQGHRGPVPHRLRFGYGKGSHGEGRLALGCNWQRGHVAAVRRKHGWDEVAGDGVGHALNGARLRCASDAIWMMGASIVSEPTLSARMTSEPVPFTVPRSAFRRHPWRPAWTRRSPSGIGDELGKASRRVISLAPVLGVVVRLRRIDRHPADRVLRGPRRWSRLRPSTAAAAASLAGCLKFSRRSDHVICPSVPSPCHRGKVKAVGGNCDSF